MTLEQLNAPSEGISEVTSLPLPPPILEETEVLSDDLSIVCHLRAEPQLVSLFMWPGVAATAPVPDASEPAGTW